jgi:hypothetical protein
VQKAVAPVPQALGVAAGQAQVPFVQAWPAGHAWPQVPQLLASVERVAQYPWPPPLVQSDWPTEQPWTHWPAAQTCPAAHFTPHAPQFCGSVPVLVQKAPLAFAQASGVAAGQAHWPPEQAWPAGQASPQVPQLLASRATSAQ